MTHPITPPPELVQQWGHDANLSGVPHNDEHWAYEQHIATRAAQYGADQELEACCEWVSQWRCMVGGSRPEVGLRAARRPKPPSLKEQALKVLEDDDIDVYLIRRALEALPND